MFKWIQTIKDILNYVKVIAENLQAINEVLDVHSESQNSLMRQGDAIMTHLITDRDKENAVRYYGQFLGKNIIMSTKDKEFIGKVAKCGALETFEFSNGSAIKTVKPFVAGEKGDIIFAYLDEIVSLEEVGEIDG